MVLSNSWTPPKDWEDDARCDQLFAPFRARNLNPHGYDAKLHWWGDTILSYSKQCKVLKFTQSDLESTFRRNGRSSKCIGSVLNDLKSSGKLVSDKDYSYRNEGWLQWSFRLFVVKPTAWTFSWFRTPPVEIETYIPIEVLEVCQ